MGERRDKVGLGEAEVVPHDLVDAEQVVLLVGRQAQAAHRHRHRVRDSLWVEDEAQVPRKRLHGGPVGLVDVALAILRVGNGDQVLADDILKRVQELEMLFLQLRDQAEVGLQEAGHHLHLAQPVDAKLRDKDRLVG